MKKLFLSAMMIVAISGTTKAQEKKEAVNFPNWVVETNVRTPRIAIVKFYNDKQELVYQEKIMGKKIKIEKPKVQQALNELLQLVVNKKNDLNDTTLVYAVAKKW